MFCLILLSASPLFAENQTLETEISLYEWFDKRLEKGFTGPFGSRYYYGDGFRMDSSKGRLKIKIGGEARLDGGYIAANDTLQETFSDLQGWKGDFRELKLRLSGTFLEDWKFRFDMDFANIRQIKDIWISYGKIPFLGVALLGHAKVPFSLEGYMSNADRTFMETALPVEAIFPGRNIGILLQNTALDNRMTWAAGYYLITGSFSDVVGAADYMSEAFGSAVNLRLTGLPQYEDDGRKLIHLGFSYSHQFRDDTREDSSLKLRSHPESRLTEDSFVNTGKFLTQSANLFGYEAAVVRGPLSFQGELLQLFADAESVGNPNFWGFYLYGSYVLTGEHRSYDRSTGVFKGIRPAEDFHFTSAGWGALEAALRLSYVDLNSRDIQGGKQMDLTFGFNWYLNRFTRIMFNYVRARATDREDPPIDGGIADIFQVRFQFKL